MKRYARSAFFLMVFVTVACSNPLAVLRQGDVEFRARANALEITNRRSDRIYYFAVGGTIAPLILWAPCVQPDTCKSVRPDETLSVSYDEVAGGKQETTIVYWWHLVPAVNGTFTYDSIRSTSVTQQ